MSRSRILFILPVIALSCSAPLPSLEGVDSATWKDDKNACGRKRENMETAVIKEAEKLKGLSEMDVIELLGRPDENELYKRNQKFYSYYITPGPECPDHGADPHKLIVRFNAMGYAQLVSVEK